MSKIRIDNLFEDFNKELDELDLEDPEVFERVKKELKIDAEIIRAEKEGGPISEETYWEIINL